VSGCRCQGPEEQVSGVELQVSGFQSGVRVREAKERLLGSTMRSACLRTAGGSDPVPRMRQTRRKARKLARHTTDMKFAVCAEKKMNFSELTEIERATRECA
jgi:hypothetical protein